MSTTQSSFPFFKAPAEIQIQILKNTDLVSPCSYYSWEGVHGFHARDDRTLKRYTFTSSSFFLVSKSFSTLAQEIFWSQNEFCICRHLHSPHDPRPEPGFVDDDRYIESVFLTHYRSSTLQLPRLRSLVFTHFLPNYDDGEGQADVMEQEWLRTAENARSAGHLNLDYLRINRYVERLDWETLEPAPDGEMFRLVKVYINTHLWPLEDGKPPEAISKRLAVSFGCDSALCVYRMRRIGSDQRPLYPVFHSDNLDRWYYGKNGDNSKYAIRSVVGELGTDGSWVEEICVVRQKPL